MKTTKEKINEVKENMILQFAEFMRAGDGARCASRTKIIAVDEERYSVHFGITRQGTGKLLVLVNVKDKDGFEMFEMTTKPDYTAIARVLEIFIIGLWETKFLEQNEQKD